MKKKILIFHYDKVTSYPPVISLVQNLIHNGHKVCLMSFNSNELPQEVLQSKDLSVINISFNGSTSFYGILKRKLLFYKKLRILVKNEMNNYDVLWTTTDLSVRVLGKLVLDYKHIMQLMELKKSMPLFRGTKKLTYPIDMYARKAWKVVVPEVNRAYIQKTWWQLDDLPCILPNKPYKLTYPYLQKASNENEIEKYFNEKRKVILYLGFVGPDRRLKEFAEAIVKLGTDKYCLYVIGKIDNHYKQKFKAFLFKYKFVNYLGYYNAPNHLPFLRKAYIGILPYYVNNKVKDYSPLNALYCAPNKLYEYAGFSVPMVGTDVLGLKFPFEEYNIGVCAKKLSSDNIADAILQVETNYNMMKSNCKVFFDSVDLDEAVSQILSD